MTLLVNKHIIFYRTIDVEEIEIERILGAEIDLKKE
jgi:toxin ParE1/3/4